MQDFTNKVVWITGASSGIGEALVYQFCALGAKIILSARKVAKLNEVKEKCTASEDSLFVLPIDLSISDSLQNAATIALQKWGRVDYMIHNAGIASRSFVAETNMEVYKKVMETNFFGPVAITQALLPGMKSIGSGHFVVISSLSGKYGVPKLSAYAASKHALHGFFESLRAEINPFEIKVSIIIPGFINTAVLQNALNAKGEPVGKNMAVNEKGMSAKRCADQIIKYIKQQKEEALIGGSEVWTVHFKRFFPDLFSVFIRNHPIRKMQTVLNAFKKRTSLIPIKNLIV